MSRRIDKWSLLMALPFVTQATLAGAATCEETLPVIEQLYNNTVDNCTGPEGQAVPASDCSGLIARGTQRPEHSGGQAGDYRVWKASPSAVEKGTVAATYLRKDIKYRDVIVYKDGWRNYNNGFLVTPPHLVPEGEPAAYLACATPVDMWADERDDQGCGDNRKTPGVEKSCQELGIKGTDWANQYAVPNLYKDTELIGGNSCTNDMRTMDASKSTAAFKDFLDARKAFQDLPNQDVAFNSYTEVRYTNTPNNQPPILAFFHTDDEGREDALKNQAEYLQDTGKEVPVVQITYPKDKDGVATFSCEAKPAPAPVPEPAPDTTAADLAAGGWGTGSDPKQCSRYFDSVTWLNRWDSYLQRHVDSVSVRPSACGREIGADQTDAAFAEMQAKAKALPGGVVKWNSRDDTLRRQFVCHLVLVEKDANGNPLPVKYKEEFNLEPIRKYVTHEQSLVDKCNTPLTDDQTVGGWGANGSAQCTQYVDSVKWVKRRFAEYGDQDIMSLEVTPTECGRNIGPDQTEKMMAEIKKKALAADPKGAEFWGAKDDSMRRQTVCLMKLYRDKSTWNIESKRPNGVSAAQAEAAQCNFK
ncbi:DUF2599 domain-containing protein [Pseudomonas sp. zfem002]|uniref:DUF2599 domain-containing protein n=1 Tax=Pseudomonas sp. zfem002 TaxID=3078197 RepID=UPI002929A0F2|nr:DUF2599 domain-containing protein [Pseudomonas sp. zfem002]MDU9393548.1 DUF2599 domain-containing protein [Pseudomonas sp. zfem002]